MARYIDADALLNSMYNDHPKDVMKYIAEYPTADVVEVIRCKDCRYGKERCGNIECGVELHGYGWFCPVGKQKEDDMKGENNG